MIDDRNQMTHKERDEMANARLSEFGYMKCTKCGCQFLSMNDSKMCIDCRRVTIIPTVQTTTPAPAIVIVPRPTTTIFATTTSSPYTDVDAVLRTQMKTARRVQLAKRKAKSNA